jgi:hypothetical protein
MTLATRTKVKPPSNVSATSSVIGEAVVRWNAAPNSGYPVAYYNLYRDSELIQTELTESPAIDSAARSGFSADYAVAAVSIQVNESVLVAAPSIVIQDPDITAPTVPGSVNTTVNGTATTTTWSASTDASGVSHYRVFRNGVFVATSQDSPYVENVADGTYTYSVSAVDTSANLNESAVGTGNQVTVALTPLAPDTPINFTATAVSASQINLSWAAGPSGPAPTDYDADFSATGANGPWTALTVGLQTTFQHTGRAASTPYWYRLLAKNGTTPAAGYVTANATTQSQGSTTFVFNDGFEGGIPNALYTVSADGAGTIAVGTAHSREGTQSCQFAITNSASGNSRQELRIKTSLDNAGINSITDYWLGLSIFVPTTAATSVISVAFQWHTQTTPAVGHSPSIGIRLGPAGWTMTRELDGGNPATINLGAVTKGEWTDFVMRVVHRTTANGLIQLWMNEDVNPRVDLANIRTVAAGQTVVPYFKVGIYQSQGNLVTNRFYDALRISTNGTRASMKPVGDRSAAT